MNTLIIIILILLYLIGGIGYIYTLLNLEHKFDNKTYKIILSFICIFWVFFLIILGFAVIMTYIETWVLKKLHK